LAGVSKAEMLELAAASFETPAAPAPQDEGTGKAA
jgi:hypothetical protein